MSITDDEVRQRNMAAIHAFFDADERRVMADWIRFWHPEGRQTFFLSFDNPPVVGRDELIRIFQRKFDIRPHYGIEVVTEPFLDPNKVFVRLLLTHGEGIRPTDIWNVFTFDDQGLILLWEELVDTAHSFKFPQ